MAAKQGAQARAGQEKVAGELVERGIVQKTLAKILLDVRGLLVFAEGKASAQRELGFR